MTSVEVVPSAAAGGLQSEVPLLASEEGMEWGRSAEPIDEDHVYHFINVRYVFDS